MINIELEINDISRIKEVSDIKEECIPNIKVESETYKASKLGETPIINNTNSPKSFLKNKKKK